MHNLSALKKFLAISVIALESYLCAGAQAQSVAPIANSISAGYVGSVQACPQKNCNIYTINVQNGTTGGFFEVFDATSLPADGALTTGTYPIYCSALGSAVSLSIDWFSHPHIVANTNLYLVISSGVDCAHKTTGTATAFFIWQAQ